MPGAPYYECHCQIGIEARALFCQLVEPGDLESKQSVSLRVRANSTSTHYVACRPGGQWCESAAGVREGECLPFRSSLGASRMQTNGWLTAREVRAQARVVTEPPQSRPASRVSVHLRERGTCVNTLSHVSSLFPWSSWPTVLSRASSFNQSSIGALTHTDRDGHIKRASCQYFVDLLLT